MKKSKKPRWYGIRICTACRETLTENEVHYSGGVCPHCGYSFGSTIVRNTMIVISRERISPWWQFWAPVYEYTPKDSDALAWLERQGLLIAKDPIKYPDIISNIYYYQDSSADS